VETRLSRRQLLRAGAAGAAGAALLPGVACNSSDGDSADDQPLNVLFVIIDTLRPDHVGAYGSQVRTPHIDELVRQGLRFTRAFPEAMVTVPARRSIFGCKRIFPYRDWEPHKEIGTSPGWLPIDDPQRTFTTALREAGYWTAQISDNPFTAFMKAYEPFRQTFHEWKTIVGQSGFRQSPDNVSMETVNHWLPPFLRDERYIPGMRKYLANTGEGRDEEETCAARVFKGAAEMLEDARRRQPFAFTIDCFDPHEPWTPPPKYLDMYADPGYEGPEVGVTDYGFARNFTPDLRRRLQAVYAAEVTLTDHWFGLFMERFRDLGLDENTVVVLMSDHGYLLGERGYTGKVPSQMHPELAQVPFVIVHPNGRGAGRTSRYFASTHDVGATIMSLLGVDRPGWMKGADLSPALDGREPAERREFHYGGMYNRFFIRTDDWVLIGDNQGNERTLCNLREDPQEFRNVVADHPAVSRELYSTVLDVCGGPLPYYE
jgi:arylsulfatase A-like enzyme